MTKTFSDLWEELTTEPRQLTDAGRLGASARTTLAAALAGPDRSHEAIEDARLIARNLRGLKLPLAEDAEELVRGISGPMLLASLTSLREGISTLPAAPRNHHPTRAWNPPDPLTQEEIQRVRERIAAVQAKHAGLHGGKRARAPHRGALLSTEAGLQIHDSVPAMLRHGILATPGACYRTIVRFSTGSGSILDRSGERIPESKVGLLGLATKCFTADARPCDLLGVSKPVSMANEVGPFLRVLELLADKSSDGTLTSLAGLLTGVDRAGDLLGVVHAGTIMAREFGGDELESAAEHTYTGSVFRLPNGYACRYQFRPVESNFDPSATLEGPTALSDDLKRRLTDRAITFALEIVLYVDGPLEPTKSFAASQAHTVATLRIPCRSAQHQELQIVADDRLSFQPAHLLGCHSVEEIAQERSLDPDMMQGRWAAYDESARRRGAVDDVILWRAFGERPFAEVR